MVPRDLNKYTLDYGKGLAHGCQHVTSWTYNEAPYTYERCEDCEIVQGSQASDTQSGDGPGNHHNASKDDENDIDNRHRNASVVGRSDFEGG